MHLASKGRIDASFGTTLIAFLILVALAIVMIVYGNSLGQIPFLDPNQVGWSVVIIVWVLGGSLVSGFVIFLVKALRGED